MLMDEVFARLLDRCKVSNNKEFLLLTSKGGNRDNDIDVDEDDDVRDIHRRLTLKDYRFKAEDAYAM